MIWNSAQSTEYPNVKVFAQKKKLALMSAHDSIIAARVKQTRDANRRRQDAPFKEGDLVYLSTKNIAFTKGLARKFILKYMYMGPYKITRDFYNQSFKIDLPSHLKQRGVHDVFHASLLRIHEPNDDRLFPGRMDTQIGEGLNIDREWAVERIQSHHGSAEGSTFEIKWKSGDITWMPYYQIQHLQALNSYFEILGIQNISELPKGKGSPPREDPQIFLGAISMSPPFSTLLQHSLPIIPVSPTHMPRLSFIQFLDIKFDLCFSYPYSSLLSIDLSSFLPHEILTYTNDIPPHVFSSLVNMLKTIQHPRFIRISRPQYAINNPDGTHHWYVHVGQVMNCLTFDKFIREGKNLVDFPGVPSGYVDFAIAFNTGTSPHDKRRLSTYLNSSTGDHVVSSTTPVFLDDFHISPEECSFTPPRRNGLV
jgi:hypothetical protein